MEEEIKVGDFVCIKPDFGIRFGKVIEIESKIKVYWLYVMGTNNIEKYNETNYSKYEKSLVKKIDLLEMLRQHVKLQEYTDKFVESTTDIFAVDDIVNVKRGGYSNWKLSKIINIIDTKYEINYIDFDENLVYDFSLSVETENLSKITKQYLVDENDKLGNFIQSFIEMNAE